MAIKISLCLIVWNEIAGCRHDVPLLPRGRFHEVYAIDAGSDDGTVEYLTGQGVSVYRQPRTSLNAAYHHAVERSTGDATVVFFPKATLAPQCVAALADRLIDGFALTVASRNQPGAYNEEDADFLRPRKWGVEALALVASAIWRREGPRLTDVLHGVKGFRNDVFRRMKISDSGVTIDLEMAVRAYRLRVRRTEVPVQERPRLAGQTHFKIWPTAQWLARFLILEVFNPPRLDSERSNPGA